MTIAYIIFTGVFLLGAGSGVGFIIDTLQWKHEHAYNSCLKVLFCTRNKELFDWAQQMVHPFALNANNQVLFALTGEHDIDHSSFASDTAIEEGDYAISVQNSHFRFNDDIDAGSIVFCQGSKPMNTYVAKACLLKKAIFFGGLQSPERIEVIDAIRRSIHGVTVRMDKSLHSLSKSLHGASSKLGMKFSSLRSLEKKEQHGNKLDDELDGKHDNFQDNPLPGH